MTVPSRVRPPVQRSLPLRLAAGIITETANDNGLTVRVDGRVVSRVVCDAGLWTNVNFGAASRRVYPGEAEAKAVARRIARMLVA
jgi:hypothetical protein